MRSSSTFGALCAALLAAHAGAQQRAIDPASLGADAAAVLGLWQKYLASKAGQFSARAGEPSPFWLESEQRRWPVYDLAGFYLSNDVVPNVERVERADPVKARYRIVTRFTARYPTGTPTWWSNLRMTVYAVRSAEGWRLANALPFHTAAWRRDTVGPITYVFAADYPYDRRRARRAVTFTDSIAAVFALPHLAPLTYYLTRSVDEVYEIMGLESEVKFGPVGGAAQPVNRQLFSGIPAVGEEYRHELAHLVLAPLCCAGTAYFVSEGVATWLGGTAGNDYEAATKSLAQFLIEHPTVTLDSLMAGSHPATRTYAAGAVLTEMVHETGGVSAVKGLFRAGSGDGLRRHVERQLGRPWAAVAEDWRRRIVERR